MKTIFPIGDDHSTIGVKENMTELESFLLDEKTYIFRNGDSNIQFQGIRDKKPLEAISKKPLFVFIFEKISRISRVAFVGTAITRTTKKARQAGPLG